VMWLKCTSLAEARPVINCSPGSMRLLFFPKNMMVFTTSIPLRQQTTKRSQERFYGVRKLVRFDRKYVHVARFEFVSESSQRVQRTARG
jgi:hypothetical protein